MNSEQHRARAAQLRQKNPDSRAALLHDLAANALEEKEPAAGETDELAAAYARKLNQPDVDAET